MHYHDYHLNAYTVSNSGSTIVLHLHWNYPGEPRPDSWIEFSGVTAYDFVHTGGAIITEIQQISLEALLQEYGDELSRRWKMHGAYTLWKDDRNEYQKALETQGCKAWQICSAIGFAGFVIAKSVQEKNMIPDLGG